VGQPNCLQAVLISSVLKSRSHVVDHIRVEGPSTTLTCSLPSHLLLPPISLRSPSAIYVWQRKGIPLHTLPQINAVQPLSFRILQHP